MIIKDVVTIHIRDKPRLFGCIYNDFTKTFKDGDVVELVNPKHFWQDPVGNSFVLTESGAVYQIEFFKKEND